MLIHKWMIFSYESIQKASSSLLMVCNALLLRYLTLTLPPAE